MLEDWTIYSWYCPNCKNEVAGLKNKKNQIRVKCSKCGELMQPHRVCKKCGSYDKKQVIDVE